MLVVLAAGHVPPATGLARAAPSPPSRCGGFSDTRIGLGLRDLSMDPHSIPMVKAIIRRSSLADAEALATAALNSGSEQDTARLVQEAMGSQFAADLDAFLPTGRA